MSESDDSDLPDPVRENAQKRHTSNNREREKEESDIRSLMGSRWGRRFVLRLLDRTGWRSSSFSTSALEMARNEGARAFGQWLHDEVITLCPDLFLEMLREHESERNRSAGRRKAN